MKKQQVFYIHGGSSYTKNEDYLYDLERLPLRNSSDTDSIKKWPSTLRVELGGSYQVFTPSMPNSDNAKYTEWKIWFEKHFEFLHDEVNFVCWSLGGAFIVKYLTENKTPFTIKSLFLIAAPFDYFVSEGSREDGGDFYPDTAIVGALKEEIENITIMHSKDDFVVSYEHALKYKAALPEAELVTFEDKNHFLLEEFPELVQLIQNLA
jgi:predicted alpha/beta hydrolase family esterase